MKTLSNVELVRNFLNFTEGTVYIILLLKRKKDNPGIPNSKDSRDSTRFLVANLEEYDYAIAQCKQIALGDPTSVYRIYCSSNRRSLLKGFYQYQLEIARITNSLIDQNAQELHNLPKLGSKWKSMLAKKRSRDQKLFYLDVDILDPELTHNSANVQTDIASLISRLENQTKIHLGVSTRYGYGFVTDPFNPMNLPTGFQYITIEIKTDGYIFLQVLNVDHTNESK
jgi:hypothetical protein